MKCGAVPSGNLVGSEAKANGLARERKRGKNTNATKIQWLKDLFFESRIYYILLGNITPAKKVGDV